MQLGDLAFAFPLPMHKNMVHYLKTNQLEVNWR